MVAPSPFILPILSCIFWYILDRGGENMPEGFVTVTEAERTYHISQKTLRKWIREKILPAQEVYVNGLRQYAIATNDIEAIIAQKAMIGKIPVPTSTTEQRLAALERRVAALETLLQPVRSVPLSAAKVHKQSASSDDLPPGYVPLAEFYHNMSHSTLSRYIDRGVIAVTHGHWRHKGHAVEKALSPEQQRLFYEQMHGHTSFRRCENCPH
jgi:hypothetical protein